MLRNLCLIVAWLSKGNLKTTQFYDLKAFLSRKTIKDIKMKDRIRELRLKAKMNQTALGEILGVSQDAISKIEKGINNPTVQQIETLSRFFNVSADYILFGVENSKDIEPIEREILNIIRDDRTLFGKLIKMLEAKKTVIDSFEGVAA